jgi:hypothetical protein
MIFTYLALYVFKVIPEWSWYVFSVLLFIDLLGLIIKGLLLTHNKSKQTQVEWFDSFKGKRK